MTKTELEKKIIDYAGKQLLCAVDVDNNLYIGTSSMENFLEYRPDSLREKLASKAYKNMFGQIDIKLIIQEPGTTQSGIENFYPFHILENLMLLERSSNIKTTNKKPTHVYTIKFMDGVAKVGISNNVESRIKQIEYNSGRIAIAASSLDVANPAKLEADILNEFKERISIGEWITGNSYYDIIDYIESIGLEPKCLFDNSPSLEDKLAELESFMRGIGENINLTPLVVNTDTMEVIM